MPSRRQAGTTLALGIVGLLAIVVAVIIETAMGGGNGHRYLALHALQLAGALLILVGAILGIRRRSRH